MPHFVIEYSDNLESEANQIINTVFDTAIASQLFDSKTVKVRAKSYQHFKMGSDQNAFVHIEIHLIEGRSQRQKARLAETTVEALTSCLNENTSISVHCYDLIKEVYRKNTL